MSDDDVDVPHTYNPKHIQNLTSSRNSATDIPEDAVVSDISPAAFHYYIQGHQRGGGEESNPISIPTKKYSCVIENTQYGAAQAV